MPGIQLLHICMGMEQQQKKDLKGKIDEKCDAALLCLPCLST
jgi:hypothetical protein